MSAVFSMGRFCDLGGAERLALLALADYANEFNHAWPSFETLACRCGVSRSAMLRTVARLVEGGYLSRERRAREGNRQTSNMYTLELDAWPKAGSSAGATRGSGVDDTGGSGVDDTGVVASTPPNPSLNPQLNHKEENAGAFSSLGEERQKPEPATPRKPNPLWDALAKHLGLNPVTKGEQSRMGKAVRDLKLKGATPDTIAETITLYHAAMPDCACTPEALLKHWDQLSTGVMAARGAPNGTGKTFGGRNAVKDAGQDFDAGTIHT